MWFFQTRLKIFTPAQSITRPQKQLKKNISSGKAAHLATRKEFRKISALHKRHQRNLALYRFLTSLYCVFLLRSKVWNFALPATAHVAANENFRKVLDYWSLVWTFCPSIANLFCLQVKRIPLKLHRIRKSTEKWYLLNFCYFIFLRFSFNANNEVHCEIATSNL